MDLQRGGVAILEVINIEPMTFWRKNKVFITGLATFVLTSVVELLTASPVDYLLIGYTAVLAAASYVGRNLRGQWVSIYGIVLPILATVLNNLYNHEEVSIEMIIRMAIIQYVAFASGPPKPREYEHTATISIANKQAANLQEMKKAGAAPAADKTTNTKR